MTTYSETSMFWVVNRVTNFAYSRYNIIHPDVERAMNRFEDRCFAEQAAVDAAAEMLYKQNPELAVNFLTDYSVNTAQRLFQTWVELDRYLLVKYIDGNVKVESEPGKFKENGNGCGIPDEVLFPGYDEKWQRAVAADNGEILKVVD